MIPSASRAVSIIGPGNWSVSELASRDEGSRGHEGSGCLDVEQAVLPRDESGDGSCQLSSAQGRSGKYDSAFGWIKLF